MRIRIALLAFMLVWCGWAGAVTCPSSITGTITPTSCWPITEGSGTTITDTQAALNVGTLGGTGYTWQSNNNLSCSSAGGSGCNITTAATYNNAQPLTVVFSFAGTSGPIWQLGSSSSVTATSQYYLAYLDRLGRLTFGVSNYGNMSVLQTSLSYADGNQHIAAVSIGPASPTFGGGMRLYIDGQLVSSRNVQLANYSSGASWLIGGANATIWPDGPAYPYFNGTIYYMAWLNGTQVTDAQAEAMTGTSVSPISGVPLTTITATIGSINDATGFAPPPGTAVYFQISGIQRPNTGDFIVSPTPSVKACQINAAGNLIGPTGLYANCQLPEGAHVTMTIGSTGQPLSLIIPFQASVDLATLIMAQSDPASVITQIATAGPLLVGTTVTNPATGQVGTATITAPDCSKVSDSVGAYTLDTSTATCQIVTISASSTITVNGLIDSQPDTVYLVQDGTGGRAPTFAAPVGDTLVWVSQSPNTTQPPLPTTAASTLTRWTFTLNGTVIYGKLDNAQGTATTGAANTVLTGQGVNTADVYSATPTLGTNGGTGGSITLNGATSGAAQVKVAAAAGTPTALVLPTATGTNGYMLQTDGGTPQQLSWAPTGSATGFYFGGGMPVGLGLTIVAGGQSALATTTVTRAFTIDNCTAAWNAMGAGASCTTYPVIEVLDNTLNHVICSATGDNTGSSGTAESVTNPAISSGDVLVVINLTAEGGTCNKGMFSIGVQMH